MNDNTFGEPSWERRVPRSLAVAHNGVTSILATLDGIQRDYRGKNAEHLASNVMWLIEKFYEAEPQLQMVEDEFITVASEVPSWNGHYAASWHTLVLDIGRMGFWTRDYVVRAKLPHLTYFERGKYCEAVTADDISAWAVDVGFSMNWPAVQRPLPYGNAYCHLKQELCRAVDRRLLTKRRYKDDEVPLSTQEVEELRKPPERALLVPNDLQQAILDALDGHALKKEALAHECRVDPRRLYKPLALKELMDLGLVDKKRGLGYYRPDSPPENAINLAPKRHQQGPDGSK